jgi:hypothetical protein
VTTHVRRENRGFEDLAEVGRLRAAATEITTEEVLEVVLAKHVDESNVVEVLENRLVVVNLGDGSVGVDLKEQIVSTGKIESGKGGERTM